MPTDPLDPAPSPLPTPPAARRRVARAGWAALIALAVLLLAVAAYLATLAAQTPSIDDLRQVRAAKPSVLLTADGQTLATFRRAQRQPVPLAQVSPYVISALISTEDRRFYAHHGVDVRRTIAALLHTLHGDVQGGSTITQQLARNLFPEDVGHARSVTRKLKEMIAALRIERVYSKQQILADYLNSAPFLYNTIGIEAAARTYFDKPASALDPAEAATLVAMLKGTDYYNPVLHPERATQRRNLVLHQMALTGALSREEAERWQRAPMTASLNLPDDTTALAPHFAAYARRWLLDWAQLHHIDLYRDGLVVQTTLDSKLQQEAEQAVSHESALLQRVADAEWSAGDPPEAHDAGSFGRVRGARFRYFFQQHPGLMDDFLRETPQYRQARASGRSDDAALRQLRQDAPLIAQVREAKTRLEAGFLAMDPNTGEIKAWVGSRSFADNQFDHVAQAERQPGSTFKPIVYAAALESGIAPGRGYIDGPVEVRLDDHRVWRPTDMHGFTGEVMSLADGLVYSKNTITAQVSQDVGIPRIVSLAQAMGVDQSKLDPVPSLALGTSPVTLLEMVDAYCTIAAQGVHRKPVFIRRITGADGQVLAEFSAEAHRVLAVDSAVNLIEMMRGVVQRGTGTAIHTRFDIAADVAGKTGTTQYNTDGWFILMHPGLVAGAWVGFDDQRVTMRSNYWGQGGHNAVLLVGDFFRHALRGKLLDKRAAFPQPEHPALWATDTSALPDDATNEDPGLADVLPADGGNTPIQTARDAHGVVVGDPAGVAAIQRADGPPKSAEELERAFGSASPGQDASVNASGTSRAQGSTAPSPGDTPSAPVAPVAPTDPAPPASDDTAGPPSPNN